MTLELLEHTGDAPATTLAGAITSSSTAVSVVTGTGYPTGAVGPFEHGYQMSRLVELRRGAEAGRAGADHGNANGG